MLMHTILMDMKILILYITARLDGPVSLQDLYELCYQDDSVSYFDVCSAVPEMLKSGHMAETAEGYVITEKGREDGKLTEDAIAFTVRQRAEGAVLAYQRKALRDGTVKTEIGEHTVRLTVAQDGKQVMLLELPAENQQQAHTLEQKLKERGELIHSMVMTALFDEEIS